MSYKLKDGSLVRDRRLDRLMSFDQRSRSFPVRATLEATAKPRSYTWACKVTLDQGPDGACVGFGHTHEAAASPVVVAGMNYDFAMRIYRRAQQLDEWEGVDYEGTSVLAGMKAATEAGLYKGYRWNFGIDDLILSVGLKGPAILGVNWYDGMFDPDPSGLIKVTGPIAGGHCILCNGINLKQETFRLHNSWGPTWALNGECLLSFKDMDRLLREDGEAVTPTSRLKPTGYGMSAKVEAA